MTSGHFHSVPIESIQPNREGRQRSELNGIEVLADSISRLGLINPVVLTRDLVLVAGERRLEACRCLGWTHISAQYVDEEVEEHTRRAIELEENIKREELPWPDECQAVREYFALRKDEIPGFTQADLGAALGYTQQQISKFLVTAQEAPNNPLVRNAKNFATAYGIAVRAVARRQAEVLEQIHRYDNPKAEVESGPVLNLDFNEWAKTYKGERFNFVHCDFPYGIGANEFNQGGAATHGGYKDTPETYWKLCESLCAKANLDRLCTDDCHFMFWFSMRHYTETLAFFAERGIEFDPTPLVWMKSDNKGIIPEPSRGPRKIYETAFFGSRSDRPIVRPVSNAIAAETDQTFHMSIKPEPVLQHFFQMFVDENTRMLDPTAGSGSSLRAAKSLNARYVLGLEIDKDFCEQANRAVRAA